MLQTWTKKLPTKPGWYWFREAPGIEAQAVQVFEDLTYLSLRRKRGYLSLSIL